jgi:hypothetical protein
MYQAYPGGAEPPGPSQQTTAPPSVLRAVQLMYAGAAASLIGIAIDFTTIGSLKSDIESHNHTLTATQVNTVEHAEIGAFIVGGVIAAALWIWMARSCGRGRGWARTVSTVLFGIDTLSVLIGLGGSVPDGSGIRFYGIIVWLIGLAAIILLWRRPSSDYFKGVPRY